MSLCTFIVINILYIYAYMYCTIDVPISLHTRKVIVSDVRLMVFTRYHQRVLAECHHATWRWFATIGVNCFFGRNNWEPQLAKTTYYIYDITGRGAVLDCHVQAHLLHIYIHHFPGRFGRHCCLLRKWCTWIFKNIVVSVVGGKFVGISTL